MNNEARNREDVSIGQLLSGFDENFLNDSVAPKVFFFSNQKNRNYIKSVYKLEEI